MSKTETQSEALELAEFFGGMKKSSHRWYDGVPVHEKAAAELRRLDAENKQLNVALDEWMEKTHWVQDTAQVLELGMHRADVLRARIEALDAENKALRLMLCTAYSGALAYMDDGEMQDSRYHPSIDFKRDAPDEIAVKFARRAAARAAAKTGDAA